MRRTFPTLARTGLASVAAMTVAACGGEAETANDSNAVDSNIMFEQLGNDASALEAVGNSGSDVVTGTETEANGTAGNSSESDNVFGETTGGDTGGNTVDRNVSGM